MLKKPWPSFAKRSSALVDSFRAPEYDGLYLSSRQIDSLKMRITEELVTAYGAGWQSGYDGDPAPNRQDDEPIESYMKDAAGWYTD